VQNWPKHTMSILGPRRSFNLHIARRYHDIVDRRCSQYVTGFEKGQGDTLQQGRLEQNLYFATEDSKSYHPHGSRLLSFHAHENVVSRVVFCTATCTCQSLTASVDSKTAVNPSTSPTSPCEVALRISTLHPYACPTVKCHESCTCNRRQYCTPAFGRYNVTLL
jgi:hypothetical protein